MIEYLILWSIIGAIPFIIISVVDGVEYIEGRPHNCLCQNLWQHLLIALICGPALVVLWSFIQFCKLFCRLFNWLGTL